MLEGVGTAASGVAVEEADAAGPGLVGRVQGGAGEAALAQREADGALGDLLVDVGPVLTGVELDDVGGLAAIGPGGGVVRADTGALPLEGTVRLAAGPVQVAAGDGGVQAAVGGVGMLHLEAGHVGEAVPEAEDHVAVALDGDVAQDRLGVGDHLARLREGGGAGRPRVPAVGRGGADGGLAAREVEGLGEERRRTEGRGNRVVRPHGRSEVARALGGLGRAGTADVHDAVAHAESEGPPVAPGPAARVRDGHGGHRRGGGRLPGVVRVQAAVVEVDGVELPVVLGDVDVAEGLLADGADEGAVEADGVLVRGGAGVGDGGEQRGGAAVAGGDVDGALPRRTVDGVPLGVGAGEDAALRLVVGNAVGVAGVVARGEGGGVATVAVAAFVEVEGHRGAHAAGLGGRDLADGAQPGVVLAPVGRVAHAHGELGVPVDHVDDGGVRREATCGTEGGLEEGAVGHLHPDVVLAAGKGGVRRKDRVSVGTGHSGDLVAVDVCQLDGDAGCRGFGRAVVAAVGVGVADDFDADGAVAGIDAEGGLLEHAGGQGEAGGDCHQGLPQGSQDSPRCHAKCS